MSTSKHVFDQSCDNRVGVGLGDAAVRSLCIRFLIDHYRLDAYVVPGGPEKYRKVWELVFGDRLISSKDMPAGAVVHRPTDKDYRMSQDAYCTFDPIFEENGFMTVPKNYRIPAYSFVKCNPESDMVFIYPEEVSMANADFDSKFWCRAYDELRQRNKRIFCMHGDNHRLRDFYSYAKFDRECTPTVDGMIDAIRQCSFALGASTGPTWFCMLTDIKQLVLDNPYHVEDYWYFSRCERFLEKRIVVLRGISIGLRF